MSGFGTFSSFRLVLITSDSFLVNVLPVGLIFGHIQFSATTQCFSSWPGDYQICYMFQRLPDILPVKADNIL